MVLVKFSVCIWSNKKGCLSSAKNFSSHKDVLEAGEPLSRLLSNLPFRFVDYNNPLKIGPIVLATILCPAKDK